MLTHHCGIPNRKSIVPSSGSTIQRRPLLPETLPALLPHEPVLRPALAEQLADRALGRDVGFADEVGGRALAAHLALGSPPDPLEQQRAGHARGLDGNREELVGLAHANAGGRCCAQGRSVSICAASESSVVSSPSRPTICTARGSPSPPKPAGTETAGWPVAFQTPL